MHHSFLLFKWWQVVWNANCCKILHVQIYFISYTLKKQLLPFRTPSYDSTITLTCKTSPSTEKRKLYTETNRYEVHLKSFVMNIFVHLDIVEEFSDHVFSSQHLFMAKEADDSLRRCSWTADALDNVNLVSSPIHSGYVCFARMNG